jgi:hypothetical protein
MTRNEALIAVRIRFLELALEGMEEAADDAETALLAHPTSATRGWRVDALYALAGETWACIQALRGRLGGGGTPIYFDGRLADPREQAARRALG